MLLYFVGCGISRLARYNITAETMSADAGKVTYFEGTPIPTSVLLVLVLVALAWAGRVGDAAAGRGREPRPAATCTRSCCCSGCPGSLMISKTLHIPKP